MRRNLLSNLLFGMLGAGLGAAISAGCASLRPTLETARVDFSVACTRLAQVLLGEDSPSRAERIASRVCQAEQMGQRIEREIVADVNELEQDSFSDAGAR